MLLLRVLHTSMHEEGAPGMADGGALVYVGREITIITTAKPLKGGSGDGFDRTANAHRILAEEDGTNPGGRSLKAPRDHENDQ